MKLDDFFRNFDLNLFWDQYIIPWSMNIISAVLVFIIGLWIAKMVTKLIIKGLSQVIHDPMLIKFLESVVKYIFFFLVIVVSLSELGVDTTSLIAIIGAAGLAIGLALKDSLQNFAAGVMLILLRPFRVGDAILAGDVGGVVKSVGIFYTIFAAWDNKEIIVPNGQIMNDSITNFSTNDTRRVDMTFGIGYGDDLKKAKDILTRIVEDDERVLPEPAYTIAVSELGDSSVNFIFRPWVKSSDYWKYFWDTTERVKLEFDKEGISIPFPQMDVHFFPAGKAEAEALAIQATIEESKSLEHKSDSDKGAPTDKA